MANQGDFDLLSLFAPAAITTNTNGTQTINLLNYINFGGRNMTAFLNVGAVTGTSPTLDWGIQNNTTSGTSGFADVSTGSQVSTSGTATLRFVSSKQYLRPVFTVGGTSPSFTASLCVVAELKVK